MLMVPRGHSGSILGWNGSLSSAVKLGDLHTSGTLTPLLPEVISSRL